MKFQFLDHVEVLSGPFEGATGQTVDYFTISHGDGGVRYVVVLDASPDRQTFHPDNLKLVENHD